MDTSTDFGVSLDELSVEFEENDNLKPVTVVRDSRNRVDTDVFDVVDSQNIDVYDTVEMTASTDLGVSLDELIVEMNEDDNTKQIATIDDPRDKVDVIKFGNTLEIEEHDTSAYGSTDLDTWSTHGKMIVTKPINIEDETHSSPVLTTANINISNKDDSDNEFEVPDRPLVPPENASIVQSVKAQAEFTLNPGPGMQYSESQQDTSTNLTSQNPRQFQHEILHSHNEISADPVILYPSSQTLQMTTAHYASLPIQNNFLELLEENKEGSLNSSLEEDLKKKNQDFPPKSEPPISSQFFMQHQILDVTKPQMIFPDKPETEVGQNNENKYSRPSIVTTADDWENIQTIEPGFLQSGDRLLGPELIIESKPLTSFSESWTYFKMADYTSVKGNIKVQVERHGLSALTHMLFGPPKLHRDLLQQRELIFCVAATPFDNNSETHNRILQTIYRCITGSRFDCQRFGSHWEEIGFQGKDPATDLRGTGMLSLLHLLYFLQGPSTKELARDIYKLSLHPTQNFPFCVMSINLSRICLQVLREDVYNKECNRSKDVISTVNNIYAALFLRLYGAWKKGKTIMDSGFVIQEIETFVRKHSKDIFKEFKTYEQAKKQHGQSRKDSDDEPIFLNVCKEDKS